MRRSRGGTKKSPHPELVEGRTALIPARKERAIRHEFSGIARRVFGVYGAQLWQTKAAFESVSRRFLRALVLDFAGHSSFFGF
jgi:hypothetical protein